MAKFAQVLQGKGNCQNCRYSLDFNGSLYCSKYARRSTYSYNSCIFFDPAVPTRSLRDAKRVLNEGGI